jgi:putative ABC transport system permease protein
MFKLNLKIALRNLLKYKVYTFINILGLSIGMASCILIFIFIRYQLSFDQEHKNSDRIYRFVTDWKYNNFVDNSSGSPIPLAAAARNELPGIEKIAVIAKNSGVIIVRDAKNKQTAKVSKTVFFAEPQIFDILNVSWIAGKREKFEAPNTVVLSETTANLFFGSAQKAIGRNFSFWNQFNLEVVGVFKDRSPASSVPMNIVISFRTGSYNKVTSWENVSTYDQCYLLLKKGTNLQSFQSALNQFNYKHFTSKHLPGNQHSSLQPLKDIHFSTKYSNFAETTISKKDIYGLAIIGMFLMLTACINFINLATAQSINRSKEVGVRKVLGSKRQQLISQFLLETIAITLLSLIIACILAELAIPVMEQLFKGNVKFSLFNHPAIIGFMLALVCTVSLLAGAYPALVMSGFSPALAIKNKITVNAGNLNLRKILVVLQFSVTVILIISTIVITKQLEFVRKQPLGFDSDAIAMVGIPGDSLLRTKMTVFKNRILQNVGVKKASYCVRPPLSGSMNTTSFNFNGQENTDFEVRLTASDPDYFDVFKLKVIAGKVFKASDTINGYVVNETFVKKVKLNEAKDAIGKVIDQNGLKAPIIGIVKDFNDQSLKEQISPMIFFQNKRNYYALAIKLDKVNMMNTMKDIEELWNSSFPNEVYSSQFLDDDINGYYENEQNTGLLLRVFAGVIIFISFIGVFGLISFMATQRTREVAIRRVLGASTAQLVSMLNGSFILMVFIANVIAWPLAYIFAFKWLSTFAYRTDLNIWPFLLAMIISIIATLLTVSIRSYKAATQNTVDALKYE